VSIAHLLRSVVLSRNSEKEGNGQANEAKNLVHHDTSTGEDSWMKSPPLVFGERAISDLSI
jgi:hypothetical protein